MRKEKVRDETRVQISLWKTCKMLEYVLEENLKHVQEEYIYANILILQFFTFEAFLNFLGQNIEPEIWEKERTYFNDYQFNERRGTLGKFWFLASKCDCEDYFENEEGEEYYLFVEEELKEIRDFFAHAKPEIYETERLRDPDKFPEQICNFIDENINIDNVKKGFEYIEQLILKLHNKANDIYQYDKNIKNPLDGPDRILTGRSTYPT